MLVFLSNKNFWVCVFLKIFNGIVLNNNTFLFVFSLLSFVFLRLSLLRTAAVCSFIRMVLSCINTPGFLFLVCSKWVLGSLQFLTVMKHAATDILTQFWCLCASLSAGGLLGVELLDRRMCVSSALPNNPKPFSKVVVSMLFSTSSAQEPTWLPAPTLGRGGRWLVVGAVSGGHWLVVGAVSGGHWLVAPAVSLSGVSFIISEVEHLSVCWSLSFSLL